MLKFNGGNEIICEFFYPKGGYNMDNMQQCACLFVNPITVYIQLHNGGSCLGFNSGPDVKLKSVSWCLILVFERANRGST